MNMILIYIINVLISMITIHHQFEGIYDDSFSFKYWNKYTHFCNNYEHILFIIIQWFINFEQIDFIFIIKFVYWCKYVINTFMIINISSFINLSYLWYIMRSNWCKSYHVWYIIYSIWYSIWMITLHKYLIIIFTSFNLTLIILIHQYK